MNDQVDVKGKQQGRHGSVSGKAQNLVWARSAGRCQFENCNEDLTKHLVAGSRSANKSYIAHIIGSSAQGPRGDAVRSEAFAKNPENVMLLCDGCHREIDKEHPEAYPEERLRGMKQRHEAWVARAVGLKPASQSHVLRFTNRIEANETAIPFDDCVLAMQGIGKTPASSEPIDLKLGIPGHQDTDDLYWAVEPNDLQIFFHKRFEGFFNNGKVRHLSVFGFGPMPLLMKLGQLLPDLHDIDVFTRHREPTPSWAWREGPSQFKPFVVEDSHNAKRVAIKLAITDRISDERIHNAVGSNDLSIWEITCAAPGYDVLKVREDLSNFRRAVRTAFNRIKEAHGECAEVLVFPAAPAACCIEFGRVWQPKAHRPMEIYDQVKGAGFVSRLRIE